MNISHLKTIRLIELDSVLFEINKRKPGPNVLLEIGAGSGWQSKRLAENGQLVEAIDLSKSTYLESRVWPITNYDGIIIPFPNSNFDIVFSSNVLEHIAHIIEFQSEIQRVLKDDGIVIHVVPSSTWRLWTALAHYAFVIKYCIGRFYGGINAGQNKNDMVATARSNEDSNLNKVGFIKKVLVPPTHGEIGNAASELYYLSKYRWYRLFGKAGWSIDKVYSNNLFYTGYTVLGPMLSMKSRNYLSKILGGSCNIFILKKQNCGQANK